MKLPVLVALTVAALATAACAGPEGNPNAAAYANEDGGAIAVKPETIGMAAYDPYGKAAPFKDMDMGGAAISPSATPPLTLTPAGQSPAPAGTMPRR